MKNQQTLVIFLVVVFLFLVGATGLIVHSQKRDELTPQDDKAAYTRKKIEENGDPLVDISAPDKAVGREQSVRAKRGARFNLNDKSLRAEDREAGRLNEKSPQFIFGGPSFNLRPQPAFPIKANTFVVKGKITTSNAYLSDDKTTVYSEFELSVDEILKQSSEFPPLVKNSSITLNRWGGKVRLPSGNVLHRGITGNPLPQVGREYILFLSYEPLAESFYINTLYEITDGKVFPYDGKDLQGQYFKAYESYKQYENYDEKVFIEEIFKAINASGGNGQ